MRQGIIAGIAVLVLSAATARADSLTEPPEIPAPLSLSQTIQSNLTLMSLELNDHLGKLSFDLVDLKFDVTGKRAKFRLGGGDEGFGLKLDSDIKFQSGYARVQTTIDLRIAGEGFSFTLPEVDMVPRSADGEYEIRWPIFKGRF